MEHFEVNYYAYLSILKYDFSPNSALLYLLGLIFFVAFFFLVADDYKVFGPISQLLLEKIFIIFMNLYKQQISSARFLRFFPLIFTLFIYIFILNFTSLFAYGVSITGYITVTSFLSFSFFFAVVVIGLINHGTDFFNLFIPQNVPKALVDFLVVIEILSFLIRPFSLAIRLFANMLAGHTLLGIFSQFGAYVMKKFFIFVLLPFCLILLVFFLEIAVSLIQAYIFVSLILIYFNDIIILH